MIKFKEKKVKKIDFWFSIFSVLVLGFGLGTLCGGIGWKFKASILFAAFNLIYVFFVNYYESYV